MLYIDAQNNIELTKGDTLILTATPKQNGSTYEPQEGDTIRFACSIGYKGEPGYVLKIEKNVPTDTFTFTVPAAETEELEYLEYNYDVELTHNGAVYTYISAKLKITGESK